jgi:hypothetical protein
LEELGPFENIADANGEFKGSPRFKRDLEWTENGTHRINQYSKTPSRSQMTFQPRYSTMCFKMTRIELIL